LLGQAADHQPPDLDSPIRGFGTPGVRNDVIGFRCCCGSVVFASKRVQADLTEFRSNLKSRELSFPVSDLNGANAGTDLKFD
jgi:hypothetical protein